MNVDLAAVGAELHTCFGEFLQFVTGDIADIPALTVRTEDNKLSPAAWGVGLLLSTVAMGVIARVFYGLGNAMGHALKFRPKRRHIFSDTVREFLFYSMSTAVMVRSLSVTEWAYNWRHWDYAYYESYILELQPDVAALPDHLVEYHARGADQYQVYMQMIYMLTGGWYLQGILTLILEPKKKDFVVMMIHHFFTTMLIVGSSIAGHSRIGLMVMAIHDSSDIFLHGAKLLHYTLLKHWLHVLCDITFALFALIFLVTRLIVYPVAVYSGSTLVYNCGLVGEYVLYCFLVGLLPLHIMWFKMILKILSNALLNDSVQGDVRDDEDEDEDEDEEEEEKKNK